jgi:hypothetical protein
MSQPAGPLVLVAMKQRDTKKESRVRSDCHERLIHPSRTGSSVAELPFELGPGGQVANSNLGNGNLRPETFGENARNCP